MLRRLGVPDLSRHKALVTGIGIDALGSGVFLPVSILYFLFTTDVGKARVGLALSICALVAVPFVLIAGTLVDHFGAKRMLLSANLIQCLGYACYPLVDSFAGIIVVGSISSIGQSAFWSSYSPLVAASTPPGEREIWFGFLGALRNVGFAVGGVASAVAVGTGSTSSFTALVLVNAAGYLAAFLVLLAVPATESGAGQTTAGPDDRARSGWAGVLRDGRYLRLTATNACYAITTMALNIVMPVYAIDVLRLPGWVSGALFTVNTVLVGLLQSLIVRAMDGHTRNRVIALGFAIYAVSFGLFALSGPLPVPLATVGVLGAVAVFTFGEILGGPPLTAAAVEAAPEAARGRYLSAYQLSWTLSGILCPALFLALLAHDRYSVWAALVLVALAGTLIIGRLARVLPAAAARIASADSGHP